MAVTTALYKGTSIHPFSQKEREAQILSCYVSVLTTAGKPYEDYKRYDAKSLYGYAQIVSGTYVLEEIAITQENQRIWHFDNRLADLTKQITCARKAIRDVAILVDQGQNSTPPTYPVPLEIPLIEATGIAFKFPVGTSVRLQVISRPLMVDCGYTVSRTDPNNERKKGTSEPGRNSGNPDQWDGLPPYGYSDDGSGLDDNEDLPTDAGDPPAVATIRIYYDAPLANTGLPCGQETTSYSGSITQTGAGLTIEGWTMGPGSNPRSYCGRPLRDGFELFYNGVSRGVLETGAGHFVTPFITSVVYES